MRQRLLAEAQIIRAVKEAEAGEEVRELRRRNGITETTFCRWRKKCGGLEVKQSAGCDSSRMRTAGLRRSSRTRPRNCRSRRITPR